MDEAKSNGTSHTPTSSDSDVAAPAPHDMSIPSLRAAQAREDEWEAKDEAQKKPVRLQQLMFLRLYRFCIFMKQVHAASKPPPPNTPAAVAAKKTSDAIRMQLRKLRNLIVVTKAIHAGTQPDVATIIRQTGRNPFAKLGVMDGPAMKTERKMRRKMQTQLAETWIHVVMQSNRYVRIMGADSSVWLELAADEMGRKVLSDLQIEEKWGELDAATQQKVFDSVHTISILARISCGFDRPPLDLPEPAAGGGGGGGGGGGDDADNIYDNIFSNGGLKDWASQIDKLVNENCGSMSELWDTIRSQAGTDPDFRQKMKSQASNAVDMFMDKLEGKKGPRKKKCAGRKPKKGKGKGTRARAAKHASGGAGAGAGAGAAATAAPAPAE